MRSEGLGRLGTLVVSDGLDRFSGVVHNDSVIGCVPADFQGECTWETKRERERHRIMTMYLRR